MSDRKEVEWAGYPSTDGHMAPVRCWNGNHLQQFAARHRDVPPLTESEVLAMLQWVTLHGPANCWTGTSGDPCRMIRSLLIERANLLAMLEKVQTP